MSLTAQILCYVVGGAVALAVLIALFKNQKPVRTLIGSGVQGICALAAVNITGFFTGVSVGINTFTALVCLVLGVPGVVATLALKVIFKV